MTDLTLSFLITVVAFVGIVHTLTGPDHYVPFIAMARAGQWSTFKTFLVTVFCGIGHVWGSIVLGALGIGLGWALSPLQSIEGFRGSIAGWLLIGFGLAYAAWGFRRASRAHKHTHWHKHADGTTHAHEHDHHHEHAHAHADSGKNMTPWILFTIFVFGPCEPLIPLLMLPAVQRSTSSILIVSVVFAICTIATMTTIVMLALRGIQMIQLPWLERHTHTLAGSAIALCGLAVQFGL